MHAEPAVLRPDMAAAALSRSVRADLRALLLLFYVVTGACLIVTSVEPMTLTLTGLLAGPEPGDLAFETIGQAGIGGAIVCLAVIGALLAGEAPTFGAGGRAMAGGSLLAGGGAVAIVLAAAWIGGIAIVRPHDGGAGGGAGGGLFALGTLLTALGALGEELLMRGLLQPVLIKAWGPVAGIALAALAFAVIHVAGGWGHPVSLLNILLAGLWFGLLARRAGGLAAPLLAHFGYNWTEEMLFGASPNPGIGRFGAILDVDLTGPAIWGGSVEGLNASLAVSVVLLALIVPLALRPGRLPSSGKATARL